MSYGTDQVIAAAAYLDKWHANKDWRSEINLDTLAMYSTENCILGQIDGDYDIGQRTLRAASGTEAWYAVSEAFGAYTDEWIDYLRDYVAPVSTPVVTDEYAGTEWHGKRHGTYNVLVDHSFKFEGETYVVYTSIGGHYINPATCGLSSLRNTHTLQPKYVVGRLYLGADKKTVAMFAGGDEFHRLNNNYGVSVTHGSIEHFERKFGPLSEITNNLDNHNGATLNVTITD